MQNPGLDGVDVSVEQTVPGPQRSASSIPEQQISPAWPQPVQMPVRHAPPAPQEPPQHGWPTAPQAGQLPPAHTPPAPAQAWPAAMHRSFSQQAPPAHRLPPGQQGPPAWPHVTQVDSAVVPVQISPLARHTGIDARRGGGPLQQTSPALLPQGAQMRFTHFVSGAVQSGVPVTLVQHGSPRPPHTSVPHLPAPHVPGSSTHKAPSATHRPATQHAPPAQLLPAQQLCPEAPHPATTTFVPPVPAAAPPAPAVDPARPPAPPVPAAPAPAAPPAAVPPVPAGTPPLVPPGTPTPPTPPAPAIPTMPPLPTIPPLPMAPPLPTAPPEPPPASGPASGFLFPQPASTITRGRMRETLRATVSIAIRPLVDVTSTLERLGRPRVSKPSRVTARATPESGRYAPESSRPRADPSPGD